MKTILFTAHLSVIINYALSNLICNDICGFKKCYSLQTKYRQHNCTKVTFFSWVKWYNTNTDVYYISYEEKLRQFKTILSTAFSLPSRLSREKRETRDEWPLSRGKPRDRLVTSPSQVENKSYFLQPIAWFQTVKVWVRVDKLWD